MGAAIRARPADVDWRDEMCIGLRGQVHQTWALREVIVDQPMTGERTRERMIAVRGVRGAVRVGVACAPDGCASGVGSPARRGRRGRGDGLGSGAEALREGICDRVGPAHGTPVVLVGAASRRARWVHPCAAEWKGEPDGDCVCNRLSRTRRQAQGFDYPGQSPPARARVE